MQVLNSQHTSDLTTLLAHVHFCVFPEYIPKCWILAWGKKKEIVLDSRNNAEKCCNKFRSQGRDFATFYLQEMYARLQTLLGMSGGNRLVVGHCLQGTRKGFGWQEAMKQPLLVIVEKSDAERWYILEKDRKNNRWALYCSR